MGKKIKRKEIVKRRKNARLRQTCRMDEKRQTKRKGGERRCKVARREERE